MDSNVMSGQRGSWDSECRPRAEDKTADLHGEQGFLGETIPALPCHPASDTCGRPAVSSLPKDRRRTPRFQCSGSVEFQADGSDQHIWGRLTDISLHGCYAETPTTFPVETAATVEISALGVHVSLHATVRASYPVLGMGMCFTEIDPEQQLQLERLMHALVEQRSVLNHATETRPGASKAFASANAWSCLKAISSFFEKNSALSRDEFYSITNRIRCS